MMSFEAKVRRHAFEVLDNKHIRSRRQAEQFLDAFLEFEIFSWETGHIYFLDNGELLTMRYMIEDNLVGLIRCGREFAVNYILKNRNHINDWLYNEDTQLTTCYTTRIREDD